MDDVRISRTCVIPANEISWRFARSGGPGGQNVNKRETQVELIFDVARTPALGPRQRARVMERLSSRLDSMGRLRIVASTQRTQGRNRDIAVERFRGLMAEALRPDPPARRPTKPSRRATQRRLTTKKRRSMQKRERSWRPED